MKSKRDDQTDKMVKFCNTNDCRNRNECELCRKMFEKKTKMESTLVHHLKNDILNYPVETSYDMIADLGCPNTVIGNKDVENFVKKLSKAQQENIEVVPADDNFKFGPSGPFHCSKKLKFPITVNSELRWIEVAIVQANIPMLLGNNILKPLGAVIELFPTGNGVLVLGDVEIPLKETTGGHYIIKVSDIGKLCGNCDDCHHTFETESYQKKPMQKLHGLSTAEYSKPAIRNSKVKPNGTQKSCLHEILTELNTHLNGSKILKEKRVWFRLSENLRS